MKHGNGKIANLPEHLRTQLNRRINHGEEGKELVDWLNAQPETMEVVNRLFDGKPISEQNLSLWRTHGYLRWHAQYVIMRETAELAQNSGAVEATGIDCEKMLWALKANYADMIQRWMVSPTDQMTYRLKVFKHLLTAVLAMDRAELQHERLELLRQKQANKSKSSGSSAKPALPALPALSLSNGSLSNGSLSNGSPSNGSHSPESRPANPAQAPAPKPAANAPTPTQPAPQPSAAPNQQASEPPKPTHAPPIQPSTPKAPPTQPAARIAPPTQPTAPSAPPKPMTPPYMDPRSLR